MRDTYPPRLIAPMDIKSVLQDCLNLCDSEACIYLRPSSSKNNGIFKVTFYTECARGDIEVLLPTNIRIEDAFRYVPVRITHYKPGPSENSMFYATSEASLKYIMKKYGR